MTKENYVTAKICYTFYSKWGYYTYILDFWITWCQPASLCIKSLCQAPCWIQFCCMVII